MELEFDSRGNLTPPQKFELEWEEFLNVFEKRFPASTTRKSLKNNFVDFIDKLRMEMTEEFTVWVGGSFVSQKPNPHDIDAVFSLDYRFCEVKKSVLDNVWFSGELKFTKGLDVYYSIEYPSSHKRHFLSHLNHLFWEDLYGHTRYDVNGKQFPKGFVELNFK